MKCEYYGMLVLFFIKICEIVFPVVCFFHFVYGPSLFVYQSDCENDVCSLTDHLKGKRRQTEDVKSRIQSLVSQLENF